MYGRPNILVLEFENQATLDRVPTDLGIQEM